MERLVAVLVEGDTRVSRLMVQMRLLQEDLPSLHHRTGVFYIFALHFSAIPISFCFCRQSGLALRKQSALRLYGSTELVVNLATVMRISLCSICPQRSNEPRKFIGWKLGFHLPLKWALLVLVDVTT